jgi:putative membrane protein
MSAGAKIFYTALGVWLAVWIATPIGLWLWGQGVFPALASLGVLAQAAVTLLALRLGKSLLWVAGVALAVGLFTWAVEWLGSSTGIPFGRYHYTALLQPQILGVPLLIPLAWLMMLLPAWGVTELILGRRANPLLFSALAGLAFTVWDLYLDPQMVARGLWVWEAPGGYFGIPWVNFAGWWLSAFVITLLVRPRGLPVRPLLLIYTLTWVFQAVGLGIFWGQPGPALAGFAGMGLFAALGWRSYNKIIRN